METVLIVCGAGASSTFLASRLRTLAKKRGLDLTATAASVSDLRPHLHTSSVLLVGPHLADSFSSLETEAAVFGVPALLLPATAFGPNGAEHALAAIDEVRTLRSQLSASSPEATK